MSIHVVLWETMLCSAMFGTQTRPHAAAGPQLQTGGVLGSAAHAVPVRMVINGKEKEEELLCVSGQMEEGCNVALSLSLRPPSPRLQPQDWAHGGKSVPHFSVL